MYISSLIEFKYIITLNLNIFEKYNIICVLFINITMCLNSIGKRNLSTKLNIAMSFIKKKKKKKNIARFFLFNNIIF
jgi:hypothetical protein